MSEPIRNIAYTTDPRHSAHVRPVRPQTIPIIRLGNSLGLFLSVTFVLCVLFDLWFPAYAMNSAWAVLLPGFTWITWPSLFLGLIETFAYGWYIALVFGGIYNFLQPRQTATTSD